jgi:hypothetical protein
MRLLLFCCMILFLTVLWLHQYWLCYHHVICCLHATYPFSVMLYLRSHQQFVMRCGFLLVESCIVTCFVFNSDDYSCVICWLFTIEMMFWHNLQIEITTETEDTLRTDSTFCDDMTIWEQEKCVNKFGTENNFILDYLSESSRHEANILSKWV